MTSQRIPLGRGRFAIVDGEDYVALSEHRWHCSKGRYASRKVQRNGKWTEIRMHREILGLVDVGGPDRPQVDHINNDGLDNRRANLRVCSHAENKRNSRARRPDYRAKKHSRYKGVRWDSSINRRKRWKAAIKIAKCERTLGRFASEEEAAHCYDRAARRAFGPFARLNFPLEGEQAATE